jgi:hypothetical protein
MFRITVQDQASVFAWRDTFDGIDQARQAIPAAQDEFPNATIDMQELVQLRGRIKWQSINTSPQQGFFSRLFRSNN